MQIKEDKKIKISPNFNEKVNLFKFKEYTLCKNL